MMVEKNSLAENAWLTVLARLSMLFSSFIGLPVAGYLLVRGIEQADSVASTVESIQRIQMVTNHKLDSLDYGLKDHELRIRRLERP